MQPVVTVGPDGPSGRLAAARRGTVDAPVAGAARHPRLRAERPGLLRAVAPAAVRHGPSVAAVPHD